MRAKELSNEQLATVLRTMRATGISPSPYEQECLEEAAIRLERTDLVLRRPNKSGGDVIKRMYFQG